MGASHALCLVTLSVVGSGRIKMTASVELGVGRIVTNKNMKAGQRRDTGGR
jgi:hypothetical protein